MGIYSLIFSSSAQAEGSIVDNVKGYRLSSMPFFLPHPHLVSWDIYFSGSVFGPEAQSGSAESVIEILGCPKSSDNKSAVRGCVR